MHVNTCVYVRIYACVYAYILCKNVTFSSNLACPSGAKLLLITNLLRDRYNVRRTYIHNIPILLHFMRERSILAT